MSIRNTRRNAGGATVGATLGEMADANVLDNHECLACGHSFSAQPS